MPAAEKIASWIKNCSHDKNATRLPQKTFMVGRCVKERLQSHRSCFMFIRRLTKDRTWGGFRITVLQQQSPPCYVHCRRLITLWDDAIREQRWSRYGRRDKRVGSSVVYLLNRCWRIFRNKSSWPPRELNTASIRPDAKDESRYRRLYDQLQKHGRYECDLIALILPPGGLPTKTLPLSIRRINLIYDFCIVASCFIVYNDLKCS